MESPTPLSRGAQAAWIGVLLLLLYLLLTGAGASNGAYLTPFRIVSLVLLAGLFVAWTIVAVAIPSARPRSTLTWALVAVISALTASTLLSERSRLGWEYVAYAVILAGLYLLLVRLFAHPGLGRRLVLVTSVCTLVVGSAYLVAVVALWLDWWGLVGRLAVPPTRPGYEALMYGAPGILTAFLVSAGGACVALVWAWGRAYRRLAIAIAVVVAADVVIASARSAWVGVAAGLVVAAGAAVATGQRLRMPVSRRTWFGGLALLAVGGLVLLAVGPAILRRLSTGGGEELRATLSAVSLRVFAEHPLTGAGPGTWVSLRAGHTLAGETDYYIPHGHNLPLQTIAETGALGAIAAVVLVVALARLVLPALRGPDAAQRHWAIGALFIGTYLLVHQLFDFFMDMPGVLFAAALPIAALDAAVLARTSSDGERAVRTRPIRALVPGLAAIAVAVLLVQFERPALTAESATAALEQRPDEAGRRATEAQDLDPGLAVYAWIGALAADATNADLDNGAVEAGVRRLAEQDDLPQAWLDAAALALARGDRATAAADMDRALRLGIQQAPVAVLAIPLLLELGQDDRAVEAATAAFLLAPSVVDDPWWDSSSDLSAVREAGVARAIEQAAPTSWVVAMTAGDGATARRLAAQQPASVATNAALIIDAWERQPGARDRLEAAAVAEPLGGLAGWVSRIAAREGDQGTADRFSRWAAIGFGTSGSDIGKDVVVADLLAGVGGPGPNSDFHFRYAYRRSTPASMLVRALVEERGR